MSGPVAWLLDTAPFVTRDHCGLGWTRDHIAVNQVANFLIFLAYFSIPVSLFNFMLRLRALRRPSVGRLLDVVRARVWMIACFMCFIAFCGLTHLMDVLVFGWAPYRFFTLVDAATAAVSLPTALLLPGVIGDMVVAMSDPDDGGGRVE
jgi:amino acid transporter